MEHPLTEPLRATGEWSILGSDQRLSGELVYDPDSGIRLSLMGRFADLDPPATSPGLDRVERTITGWTPSLEVTLYGCTQTRAGMGPTVYRADWAVIGGHPDDPGLLGASKVRARIPLLDSWLPAGGLSFTVPETAQVGETAYTIDFKRVPDLVVEAGWGTVTIRQRCETVDPSPTGPRLASVREWFDIELGFPAEERIETVVNERVGAVLDFATLMTGYTADLERLAVVCDVDHGNDHVYAEEFDVLYARSGIAGTDLTEVDDERFLLDPADPVVPSVEDLLGRWLEVRARYRRPASMLFGAQRSPKGTYTEVKFLTLCHGAEALHRDRDPGAERIPGEEWDVLKEQMLANVTDPGFREAFQEHLHFANKMALIDRLKALRDHAFGAESDVIGDGVLNAIKKDRNELVHSETARLGRLPRSDRLYYLGEYIALLMKACLLRDLGLTADQTGTVIETSPMHRYLRESFQI